MTNLEPVMLTSLLLNQATHSHAESWRSLGYIPDLGYISKARKKNCSTKSRRGRSISNYHKMLKTTLQSLASVQKEGLLMHVRIGDKISFFFFNCLHNW